MSHWDPFNEPEAVDHLLQLWDDDGEEDLWDFDPIADFELHDWQPPVQRSRELDNALPQYSTTFTLLDPSHPLAGADQPGNASHDRRDIHPPLRQAQAARRLPPLPRDPAPDTHPVANARSQHHVNSFGYFTDNLFDVQDAPTNLNDVLAFTAQPPRTLSPVSSGGAASDDFESLEESDAEIDTAGMPPFTRNGTRRSTLVDLTSASSDPDNTTQHPRGVKREASASKTSEGRAPKRRLSVSTKKEIEEIDLANEAPSAQDELLQQQQQDTINAHQARSDDAPQRIGKRQCIICMENYTNATVTACGHFYCHECLIQALMAGERNSERGTGTCPVCRKSLSRKRGTNVIPISFMKKDQFEKNQRKRLDLIR